MPFLKTSASSSFNLLLVIRDFAVSHGWDVGYDTLGVSTSHQIGLQKGNIRIGLGLRQNKNSSQVNWYTAHEQEISGGEVRDYVIGMALCKGFVASSTPSYWLNTGVDENAVRHTNDMSRPMDSVWLFTNREKDAIICVVKSDLYRYTTFGFGALSSPGANFPEPIGFMFGSYYNWWENDDTLTGYNSFAPNNVGSSNHTLLVDHEACGVYVPENCLDPKYFPFNYPLCSRRISKTFNRFTDGSDYHSYNDKQTILSYFGRLRNQTTTGGVPLVPVPFIYHGGNEFKSYLGDIPIFRLVKIGAINPEQTIQYGNSVWHCFPWKQKGNFENSSAGSDPTKDPNTQDLGFAILGNDEEDP